MVGKANGRPNAEETADQASRVELYDCKECGAETRFPRYNNPGKLLETRNVRKYDISLRWFRFPCKIRFECRNQQRWQNRIEVRLTFRCKYDSF